ncbi:MAG: hypothetical protein VX871_11490 [Pseudomonadota bacterium]|nr:hypothetical protein [Pseudomonadota bacterium]
MKAFIISLAALAVATVVAAVVLNAVDMSAGSVYTSKTGSVRL